MLISPEVFLESMGACKRGIFKSFLNKKRNKTQKSKQIRNILAQSDPTVPTKHSTCSVPQSQFVYFSIAKNLSHIVVKDSRNILTRKSLVNLGNEETSFAHTTVTYYHYFECLGGSSGHFDKKN
jgi:hypothetical protein